jgi:hypothetical protein
VGNVFNGSSMTAPQRTSPPIWAALLAWLVVTAGVGAAFIADDASGQ